MIVPYATVDAFALNVLVPPAGATVALNAAWAPDRG